MIAKLSRLKKLLDDAENIKAKIKIKLKIKKGSSGGCSK